ncbi:MAG: glycosyltransferase family 39 protein [Acidobacteria bacterium]|nr:glycosyltransferase family 39 protein [Acidobacteriota bacterium]
MATVPHQYPYQAETAAIRPPVSVLGSRRAAIFLVLLSAALYVGTSFYPSLLDDADASHALVSREMLARGDYATMYLNGIRYLMKAPLHYWLVALSYRVFGQNAFATRLPVALSMVGLTLVVWEFGRRFFDPKAGFYAALVVSTSAGMFLFTRIMIPEAIYALLFSAAFYLFLRGWTGSLEPRIAYWGAALLTGLAVLARGLIGIVFPAGIIALFIVLTGSWRRWRELHPVSCFAIILAITLPWHAVAELRSPGFLWSFLVNEHINRALGTRWPPDYDAVPLWLWWAEHLVWFFPWCVFLPLAARQWLPLRSWHKLRSAETSARIFLFIWAGFIFLFFSIEFGSRMEYYSFGAWPAVALLLGLGLSRAEEGTSRGLKQAIRAQGLLAGVGVALAAALLLLVASSYRVRSGDIASLVKTHENDFYRVSMAHIFDLTPQAFADLRVPAILAAIAFGAAFSMALLLRRHGRGVVAALAVAFGMAGFFAAADLAYGAFQPLLSSRLLADKINQELRPQDQVAIYGDFDDTSSIAFYTRRRVWIYNGLVNNLVFGSRYPDAPHIFFDDSTFGSLWSRPERVFLVIPPLQRANAFSRMAPRGAWIFGESGGKIVLTNQPVTAEEPRLIPPD